MILKVSSLNVAVSIWYGQIPYSTLYNQQSNNATDWLLVVSVE